MPKTGKGGTTQFSDQTENTRHMQKGRRLHRQHQRSSPPPRPPRVSSSRPRVSPNPAEKEKTDQHGTAKKKKSQAPKRKGIPPKQSKAHQGKVKPSQKQQKPEPELKCGGKSKTEALKT